MVLLNIKVFMNIYNALNERFEFLQKNQKEFHDDFLTEFSKKISKVKFSKNSLMEFSHLKMNVLV